MEVTDIVFKKISVAYECTSFTYNCIVALIAVSPGATLILVNVTFEHIGEILSGIFLTQATLHMTNVDFRGVSPTMGVYGFPGLIVSSSFAEVVYMGGTVSLLNRDVSEYHDIPHDAPFINLKSGNIHIEGVHFLQNTADWGNGLIKANTCLKCLIINCIFEYNSATIIDYSPDSLQLFSEVWKEAQTIVSSSFEIIDCVFRNNTSGNGASAAVQFDNVLQKVAIRNCSFTYEHSETYEVVSITSNGYSPLAATGFWKYVYSDSTHKHNVSFPAIFVTMEDVFFVNCTVGTFAYCT
jgi:hypothetical protein